MRSRTMGSSCSSSVARTSKWLTPYIKMRTDSREPELYGNEEAGAGGVVECAANRGCGWIRRWPIWNL